MSKDLLSREEGKGNGAGHDKIYALFQNVQDQGAPLTYAWQGKIYTYEDGQVYQMSREQIEHLNSLSTTLHKQEMSPDGQLRTTAVAQRNRFSVREVTPQEVKRLQAQASQAAA
jgi:hypothetical protein